MRNITRAWALLLFCSGLECYGKEVTDTLSADKNDKVIVTYSISRHDRQVEINFTKVRIILGRTHRQDYDDLSMVKAVFFDRTGGIQDAEFEGLSTEAFIPPANSYDRSDDGYFLLDDQPALSLLLNTSDADELRIPMFLAEYKTKKKYKYLGKQTTVYNIFSRCEPLKVSIPKEKQAVRNTPADKPPLAEEIIETEELADETDLSLSDADDEALGLVNELTALLEGETALPLSPELSTAYAELSRLSHKVKNPEIAAKVEDAQKAYLGKKKHLEDINKKAEEEAERKSEEARQKADSLAGAQQEKADKQQKRNIWIMIGGALLAVLGFFSNQAFQHFRNLKNQKSMADMQQRLVKQAQDEARRRARNAVNNNRFRI